MSEKVKIVISIDRAAYERVDKEAGDETSANLDARDLIHEKLMALFGDNNVDVPEFA